MVVSHNKIRCIIDVAYDIYFVFQRLIEAFDHYGNHNEV